MAGKDHFELAIKAREAEVLVSGMEHSIAAVHEVASRLHSLWGDSPVVRELARTAKDIQNRRDLTLRILREIK